MTTRWMLHAVIGAGAALVGALSLSACGADSASLAGGADFDAAAVSRDPVCSRTQDCEANRVCQPSAGETVSRCRIPSGRCSPERVAVDCYPDARCETASGRDGFCSFRPPVRVVFPVSSSIALERPNRESDLTTTGGVLLQWSPLRGVSGAVTVAAIMDTVPSLDVTTGRIRNSEAVRWIWSSAEPGGPVMEGTVPLRYGRAGVFRDGRLGPMYPGDTLPRGTYYWFVFAVVRGEVVASSVAQTFRVGLPVPDLRTCASASDCFESAADALLYDCLSGYCRRRCASDIDCDTGQCEVDAPPPAAGRRGAYCALPTTLTDAGTAAPRD